MLIDMLEGISEKPKPKVTVSDVGWVCVVVSVRCSACVRVRMTCVRVCMRAWMAHRCSRVRSALLCRAVHCQVQRRKNFAEDDEGEEEYDF
jgi:hypothetical protein